MSVFGGRAPMVTAELGCASFGKGNGRSRREPVQPATVTFRGILPNSFRGSVRAREEDLRAWMVGGLDGDAAAYNALLTALAPLLRAFFGRRLFHAGDDVEDLVQETLIAIHTRRASYDRARPFTAWAFAIARHKMVDHFRRHRRTVPLDGLEEILMAEGFEDALSARMDVGRLLAGLPAKQARAIRDTKVDGLSVAEASRAGGISEADVKVSVHRGLRALAARLKGVSDADR